MTRTEIPLGQKESARLEFKGAKALDKKETIAREVVAMLNGVDQGEVWVGLRDEEERAVAVEPIPKPEVARRALQDSLIDSIEPPLTHDQVRVEVVRDERAQAVLRVVVQADQARRPFALLGAGGSRTYVMRVGARNRPMSREEIFTKSPEAESPIDTANRVVQKLVRERTDQLRKGIEARLWLRIQPTADSLLDLKNQDVVALLQDPTKSGNRRLGRNFALNVESRYRDDDEQLEVAATGGRGDQCTRVFRDGGIELNVALKRLQSDIEHDIWPVSLLEMTISLFRLARYLSGSEPGTIVADLALFNVVGWTLGEHYSRDMSYVMFGKPPRFEVDHMALPRPLIFKAKEISQEADRCGYRLVRSLYEQCGLEERDIPPEFDRQSGRLTLTD